MCTANFTNFKFCLFIWILFSSDAAVTKQNKQLTFLQNGQVDLENTITVLSLIFCSIKSLMGAILLGTSGEGVLALFRFETTIPMVENKKLLEPTTFTPDHTEGYRRKTWPCIFLKMPQPAPKFRFFSMLVTCFFPFVGFTIYPRSISYNWATLIGLKQVVEKLTSVSPKIINLAG